MPGFANALATACIQPTYDVCINSNNRRAMTEQCCLLIFLLQVATAAEADQQELAALVLEQLAVLVSDMAVSGGCFLIQPFSVASTAPAH